MPKLSMREKVSWPSSASASPTWLIQLWGHGSLIFLPWLHAKPSSWRKALLWEDACVWRPQFPKRTGPFPAHFVCLLWDGTVVARPWSCLPHHPLNSPPSTRPPACPSCPGESGNIFGNLAALRACPGKCFAGFFWSRQVICKELGEILHFLP